MVGRVVFRGEVYREGALFVGVCPELDVSSFGGTPQEAEQSLREAVAAFLDECETLGTLEEVMEEAGFSKQDRGWTPREPVLAELLTTE